MKKEETIKRRGEAAYGKLQQQSRDWLLNHPKEVKARQHERDRKGGRYYGSRTAYNSTGLPHDRNLVRQKHGNLYRPYKRIIAPESQLHHEWIPGTANFRGVALVEKDQHQHGYIDVIQILEGEITLLTEEEVRRGGL